MHQLDRRRSYLGFLRILSTISARACLPRLVEPGYLRMAVRRDAKHRNLASNIVATKADKQAEGGGVRPDHSTPKDKPRKPKKVGHEAYDILVEPLPRAKGTKRPAPSLGKMHIRKIYNAAIEAKAWAVQIVLRMIKANDEVIHEYHRLNGTSEDDDDDFGGPSEFPDPGNANRALVILSIATIHSLDASKYLLNLEPWAVEAGILRRGRRYMHGADRQTINRHTRQPDDPHVDWTEWRSLPESAPRKKIRPRGPSFEAMKWKPGESGNSAGRPPAPRYDLPYPGYLETMITINIDGTPYRLSRAQALLHHLSVASLPRANPVAKMLAEYVISGRMTRWKRPPVVMPTYSEREYGKLNFSECLEFLHMARKLNRERISRRMVIEPWLVEMALGGLVDEPPLSLIEQQIVVEATRTPWKVKWPKWWEAAIPPGRARKGD